MNKSLNHFLTKNLELKEEEVKIFKLLFLHSFFVGWYIAFFFASANGEFIVNFGSKQLPYAYIAAGIAGYIVSSVYSYLQKKVNTKILFSSSLVFMFIIAIISRLLLNIVDIKILSAFVFIWAWPFISLSGVELGGLSLRFLNLIQVKRLYGLFNMGGVLAAIFSYFAIAFLKPHFGHIYNFLYIGAFGIIISIYILFRLYKNNYDPIEDAAFRKEKQKTSLKDVIKDNYLVWIFVSALLSMMMIYITDFGFLSSVKANVAANQSAQYLALVYGLLKVGELIISYYSRRLLTNYGVKLGLTILPIFSTLIVLITAIWGFTIGAGLVFMLLFTLLKSFERIIRRGLDDPAFNILYQPLADDKKLAIQSRVGIVMQIAIATAGAVLLLFTFILKENDNIKLQYFPALFVPLLGVWTFIAFKLYYAYKNKIKQTLSEIGKDKRRGTDQYQYGSEILGKRLNDEDYFSVTFSTNALSEINPKIIEPYAGKLLEKPINQNFVKIITKDIDPTWRRRLAKHTQELLENKNFSENVVKTIQHAAFNLDYTTITENISDQKAQELANSQKVKDRITLIKYIHKNLYTPKDELIVQLLEDSEKIVVLSTLNVCSNVKSNFIVEKIAKFLEIIEYRHIAANVLVELGGSRVLPVLEKFFKENVDIDVILKIIEIYAKIGTDNAKSLLLKHINYPNRDVQIAIIFALFFCKFQANEDQKPFIELKLMEYIDSILWIYATMLDIEGHPNTLKLFLALDNEKEFYFELIFLILSFLYDPRIITLIQKNIIGKDTIFALEIMDNFFDADIKKLITYIFDDIPASSKIKHFQNLYPQKKLSLTERLKDIILQDYDRLDPWTISKAIELLGKLHKKQVIDKKYDDQYLNYSEIKIWKKERILLTLERIRKSEIADEVFVALYHPDEIVYSLASKIIFDDNPIKCFDYLANMSSEKQKLMSKLSNNMLLIDDKVRILKKFPIFFNIPENILAQMAKICEINNYSKNSTFELFNENEEKIIFVVSGMVKFKETEENYTIFAKNDVILRGVNIDDFATSLEVLNDAVICSFNRILFFNLVISNKDLTRFILSDNENKQWILS